MWCQIPKHSCTIWDASQASGSCQHHLSPYSCLCGSRHSVLMVMAVRVCLQIFHFTSNKTLCLTSAVSACPLPWASCAPRVQAALTWLTHMVGPQPPSSARHARMDWGSGPAHTTTTPVRWAMRSLVFKHLVIDFVATVWASPVFVYILACKP